MRAFLPLLQKILQFTAENGKKKTRHALPVRLCSPDRQKYQNFAGLGAAIGKILKKVQ
nr:hypothetical protein [Maliibacterium massiliense]